MANESMRRMWTDCASGWVENRDMFDRVYQPVTDAILAAAAPGPGRSVLDIGCGTGALLAATVAVGASATGVDISPVMTAEAAERVPAATVLVADAQDADLAAAAGAPFDLVLSRFGVMFFDDPVAAFANIRAACADGARTVFVCWRTIRENPTFTLGTKILLARLADPPVAPPPHAPGPMAFDDPDHLGEVLARAGWTDALIAPLDFECVYGRTGPDAQDDGVEERLELIMGTTVGQAAAAELRPTLDPADWEALLDEVRAELRRHIVDGHVRHPGACWLVTARA